MTAFVSVVGDVCCAQNQADITLTLDAILKCYRSIIYGPVSTIACHELCFVVPVLSSVGILCGEGLCCLRIWALYPRSTLILSMLGLFLTGTACLQAYAVSNYVAFRQVGICSPLEHGVWTAIFWAVPAIVDVSKNLLARPLGRMPLTVFR